MKAKRFYEISWSVFHAKADFDMENLDLLLGGHGALRPPPGEHGFPIYPEQPRFVFGKRKKGPLPSDLELFHAYWLISDRLKEPFEVLDLEAFAFQSCDVSFADGSSGPTYWLCDVVRVLDPFTEATREQLRENRVKIFSLRNQCALDFDEHIVGNARFFRTPYMPPIVFCDEGVKQACKSSVIRGVRFKECSRRARVPG